MDDVTKIVWEIIGKIDDCETLGEVCDIEDTLVSMIRGRCSERAKRIMWRDRNLERLNVEKEIEDI